GKVPERQWPKIMEACQRLAGATAFLPWCPDPGGVVGRGQAPRAPHQREGRAKARRPHHQIEGGLKLIIIDYLQLMRHEGRVESRVEQVGQISRGLKGLARELEVPVIALSQLSRAVEH